MTVPVTRDSFFWQLRSTRRDVHVAGDALAPRGIGGRSSMAIASARTCRPAE